MWWCQFIDLLRFETRASSLRNFGMADRKLWYELKTYSFLAITSCAKIQTFRVPFHRQALQKFQ